MSDEWVETTLGEIALINPDKTPKWDAEHRIQYVDIASVSRESGIDLSSVGEYSVGGAPGRARRLIRGGDVLVSTVRPNLRAFALVPKSLDGGVASTGFAVLRGTDVALSGYLWAITQTDAFVDAMVSRCTGTNYPAIRAADIAGYEVSLPPLPVQRRIVDLMTHLDVHIANLQAERDALGAAVVAFRATTWDELGMPLTPLGDLLHGITAGRSPNTSGERPRPEEQGVLKVNAVDPSGMFFPEEAKVLPEDHGMSPEWELRGGEVLVTRANTAERVAAVARVPSAVRPGLFLCDKTLRLDYDSAVIDPNFLVEMLLSPQARAQVSTMATGVGSSMVNLSQAKFRSWEIPAPSLAEQSSIAATATAMKSMLDALDAELRRLGSLRSSLLRGLLGGTVNPNPSYDGLLERAS